jgi:acyl-CoA synthetase (AMP-forming)/AMP-acid ligase II
MKIKYGSVGKPTPGHDVRIVDDEGKELGPDEEGTVALTSQYGGWTPVMTNSNAPVKVGNLSVFSGVRPPIERYQTDISRQNLISTLQDCPVATTFSGDGDAVNYLTDRGYRPFVFDDIQNQTFGWTILPSMD